jgi:hypothetical protein
MSEQINFGEHEIQLVFLNRSPKRDMDMIRTWLKSGYVLVTLSEDKAYFERRKQP